MKFLREANLTYPNVEITYENTGRTGILISTNETSIRVIQHTPQRGYRNFNHEKIQFLRIYNEKKSFELYKNKQIEMILDIK